MAGPKITRRDIEDFHDTIDFGDDVLVAYSDVPVDAGAARVERLPDFKNAGEVHRYLQELGRYPDESFDTVIATGLLEHLPEPGAFLGQCQRVLRVGGRVYVRASSVFPVHVGPDDYFHVTAFGMAALLRSAGLEPLSVTGSSPPFRTLAILTQRIMLQCSITPAVRPLVRGMVVVLPHLDRFVREQHMSTQQTRETRIDAFMPSNVQAVATKRG